MNNYMIIGVMAVVLVVVTYLNTVFEMKKAREHFESKTIPEFNFDTFKQPDAACKAAMSKCKDPFCVDFDTGTGPLMDCVKEYVGYFSETNGLIPSYQSGDWSGFSL